MMINMDEELERIKREKLKKLLEKMNKRGEKMSIVHLNEENFREEVMESEKPVIVDFWAEWCMPCRMLAPIFEELSKEYGNRMKFAKLNVDETPEIAQTFGIQGIPTLLIFHKGKVIERIVGLLPKERLGEIIESILSRIS